MRPFARRFRRAVCATSALGLLAFAPPVLAQEEGASSDAGSDEIVVTARRRDERLIDVPIAVTAYSGEALEKAGAIDITEIGQTTPNTTLEVSRGSNSTLTAFIRGVGQQDPVSGFEQGVGLYLDDVYLNRPQAAVLDIYDVERIEILRGPQGTLYGRNTIGGAVKYVTAPLPQDFSLKIKGTYGTYDQADLIVTASAPIGDLLRVGGSVARLSRGGFGDNLTTGLENYNKDVWAGRGTIELGGYGEPVLIRISGDYSKDKSDPRGGHRLIPSLATNAPVLDSVYDSRGALVDPKQEIEAYGLAMNVTAELSDTVTLRSISAWRKDKSATPIDFDALPAVDVDVPGFYFNEQISQEFQLLYEGDRLKGLLGFYYLDATADTLFDVRIFNTFAGLTAFTEADVDTTTFAVFGDATFDFSDQLSLSVGGRYTWDKREASILRQNYLGGGSPVFGGAGVPFGTPGTDFEGSRNFNKFTPRASLTFKPTPDHTLYASYSQGFKGGGFDPRGVGANAPTTNPGGIPSDAEVAAFLSFRPEKVESYELGYKGSLFDGAVNIAIAGFYADYTDVQIPGSVACSVGGLPSFCGIVSNSRQGDLQGPRIRRPRPAGRRFRGRGRPADAVDRARLYRRAVQGIHHQHRGERGQYPHRCRAIPRGAEHAQMDRERHAGLSGPDRRRRHQRRDDLVVPQQDLSVRDSQPLYRPGRLRLVGRQPRLHRARRPVEPGRLRQESDQQALQDVGLYLHQRRSGHRRAGHRGQRPADLGARHRRHADRLLRQSAPGLRDGDGEVLTPDFR